MSHFVTKLIKSSAGVLTSRIFGLLRDISIASVYGASFVTDAFFVAFAIPNLFRALFAEGALASAFVPILSDKSKNSERNALKYVTDLMVILGIILFFLILTVILFSDYIILLFLPGYSNNPHMTELASNLLKILMPYLLLVSICGIFAGYLNLFGSFYIPYSSTALLNITMISGVILSIFYQRSIYFLAYSVVIGGIIQLLYMYFFSKKYGFKFFYKRPFDNDVKRTFKLIMPAVAGVGINQLNFLTGRILASFLGFGSISFLYYANRLFQFPLGVFSIAMSSVSLAELSKAYTDNDTLKLEEIFNKALISIFIIIIPATIGLFFLSNEITSLVYERLSFDKQDTLATAFALRMYVIGLIFYSFVNLFSKAFHANKDTKTPVKVAFYAFIFNVVFAVLLLKPLGHSGIALASSLAAMINSFLLYKNLRIKINFGKIKHNAFKILFSSGLMFLILMFIKYLNLNVLINIAVCGVVYFYSLKLQNLNVLKVLK